MLRSKIILLCLLGTGLMADDYIMFPHQLHIEDMEMSCEDCHEAVADATDLAVRLLPEKDSCISCHDGDTATEDCESCHADPDEPLPFSESQIITNPQFSHRNHLSANLECASCHGSIDEDDGSDPDQAWIAGDCFSCHSTTKPQSHKIEWPRLHGMEVSHHTQSSCNTCHEQSGCDACHQVQEVVPRVHEAGFILSHSFDARAGSLDCSSCHNHINDCQTCHRTNQVMPMAHNFINWVTLSGGLHSERALDEPDNCLICHQPASDQTCQKCHGG